MKSLTTKSYLLLAGLLSVTACDNADIGEIDDNGDIGSADSPDSIPALSAQPGSNYASAFISQLDTACDCGFDDFCDAGIGGFLRQQASDGEVCLNAAAENNDVVAAQLNCFAEHHANGAALSCDNALNGLIELPDCGDQVEEITNCLVID